MVVASCLVVAFVIGGGCLAVAELYQVAEGELQVTQCVRCACFACSICGLAASLIWFREGVMFM